MPPPSVRKRKLRDEESEQEQPNDKRRIKSATAADVAAPPPSSTYGLDPAPITNPVASSAPRIGDFSAALEEPTGAPALKPPSGGLLAPPQRRDVPQVKKILSPTAAAAKRMNVEEPLILDRANPFADAPSKSWLRSAFDLIVHVILTLVLFFVRHVTLFCALVLIIFSFMPDDHHLELDPPMMLAILGVWYIVRSMWAGLPTWLLKKLDGTSGDDPEEEASEEELTSPTTILAKINEMFDLAYRHTEDLPLPRFKVYVSFVTLLHMLTELFQTFPDWKDKELRSEGSDDIGVQELETLQLYMEFADFAYEVSPTELMNKLCSLTPDATEAKDRYQLVRHDVATEPGRVGHFIAVHHAKKEVVIAIKGTSSFSDVLTDLVGKAIPHTLPNGNVVKCHEGMLAAAVKMLEDTQHMVETFFRPAGYRVVICGHSLGAGVSCLLGTFFHGAGISCQVLAYATPACLSYEAATSAETKSYMTSVVNNDDCVPRVSLVTIRSLMELFCRIDAKLEAKGRSPTSWRNMSAYLRDLATIDDDLLMTPEELRAAKKECQEDDIQEDYSLFVAGKVVSMWECASNETDKDSEPVIEVDGRHGDGGMGALRGIEVSSSMVVDHGTENYRTNLRRLMERAKKTQ